MAGVKYFKIFDGHFTRPLVTITVTGHWRILSYAKAQLREDTVFLAVPNPSAVKVLSDVHMNK